MASFSFAIAKSLFFFLIISSLNNADDSNPYEFVEKVCSELGNVDFCLQVLKSDERSKFAKDMMTLTKIAVDKATENSTKTRDYFRGVKTGSPGVLKSLKVCVGSYDIVVKNFKICLKEEDCSLIGYDIHAAADEVQNCQNTVDSNGAHDSFITPSNTITLSFCTLGEALANRLC